MSDEVLSEDFDITSEDASTTISEDVQDGKRIYVLTSTLSVSDKLNRNHRYYPKQVLREAYQELMGRIEETKTPFCAELEHSEDAKLRLGKIAGVFRKISWDEPSGKLIGECVIADTPSGNIIKGLYNSGFKNFSFSTRASGHTTPIPPSTITEGQSGCVKVDKMKLISCDIVGVPSC